MSAQASASSPPPQKNLRTYKQLRSIWYELDALASCVRLAEDFGPAGSKLAASLTVQGWYVYDILRAGLADEPVRSMDDFCAALNDSRHLTDLKPKDRTFRNGTLGKIREFSRHPPGEEIATQPDRALLRELNLDRHARILQDRVHREDALIRKKYDRYIIRPKTQKKLALATAAIVLLAFTGYKLYHWIRGPGPWMTSYYSTKDFSGEAQHDAQEALEFTGKPDLPAEVRGDNVSARFYSCLTLAQDGSVDFHLNSDDGSRLYIGEYVVLDFWGTHSMAREPKTAKVELKAGVHQLQVDWFQGGGRSGLTLEADIGGERVFLSRDHLTRPVRVGDEISCPAAQ